MSGSDSKYFQTTKRGEMHELKEELNTVRPHAPHPPLPPPRTGPP
eukprot:COSAG04_NODE_11999_length_676_cov_1.467938_1_plen_44_part_01